MNKIIICVGISGSGKSTWSTNYIRENPNTLRINRDDIRKTLVGSLDGYYQKKDLNNIEIIINKIEECFFHEITDFHSKSVIIDNTNLKQSYINRWINLAKFDNFSVEFKLFDISLEEAKERVLDRDNCYQWSEMLNKEEYTKYIDKQFEQYKSIKQYLLTYHADQIIYE